MNVLVFIQKKVGTNMSIHKTFFVSLYKNNKILSMYYSPLRYPGGKNCIFEFMYQFMSDNRLLGMSYAEPYAGGAGLALHLLLGNIVDKIYINDLDRSIFSFWDAVTNRTEDFCKWVEQVDVTMNTRAWAKEVHANRETADSFDLAKAAFFLNRTSVSGVLKGGVIGGNEQSGKYKIDARFNKADLIQRIRRIGVFSSRIFVSNDDAVDFVREIDQRDERLFIYLDPPYVAKGADLYMNSYCEKDHETLCTLVSTLQHPWLMSYDQHELVNRLYVKYRRLQYNLSQCTRNTTGKEFIILPPKMRIAKAQENLHQPVLLKPNVLMSESAKSKVV